MQFPQSVKGTEDIFGSQACLYNFIIQTATEISKTFTCEHIHLPILEHLNLFIRGIGESTDVVSKELFTWKDKGDRDLCLRPEGTAQTVRFLLEQGQLRETLKRYFYIGSMFRAEKPQKGRQREFHQIGIEIFGEVQPLTDVEVIHYAIMLLHKLGINSSQLMLNSVGCLECRPTYIKKLQEYFMKYQDQLCRSCQDRLEKNPLRILDCKQEECQAIIVNAPNILEYLCQNCSTHFEGVKQGLEYLDIQFTINPRLVRGLDYYTQTAFEITLPDLLGSQDAVCGGGRYNMLVKTLSGKDDVPAVGLALGVERIMIALEQMNHPILAQNTKVDCVIITEEQYLPKVFKSLSSLRLNGLRLNFDTQERSLNKKINRANKIGAQWIIIVGEKEMQENLFTLKNMKNSEQTQMNWETLKKTLVVS